MEKYLYTYLIFGITVILWLCYKSFKHFKLITVDDTSKPFLIRYTLYRYSVPIVALFLIQGFMYLSHLLDIKINDLYSDDGSILYFIVIVLPVIVFLYYEIRFYIYVVFKQDNENRRWSYGIVTSFPYSVLTMNVCTVFSYLLLLVYCSLFFVF